MSDAAAPATTLPVCNALWIGGDLGGIGAACLASFVRQGHRVVLFCYDPPRDAPPGVALADAAKVIPRKHIFRHYERGSYAVFSDMFRYRLLQATDGIWIDTDLYCVRPIRPSSPYVFGIELPRRINNAVLGLPRDCVVLRELSAIFAERSPVPPWLEAADRTVFAARRASGAAFTAADLPWGATGPLALTYLLTKAGLSKHAEPQTVFYPVTAARGSLLLRANGNLAAQLTEKTLTVHLWNDILQRYLQHMEKGSAIDRLLSTGVLIEASEADHRRA